MIDLIKPKTIEIEDIDGEKHTYTISRVPATVGRELVAKYPVVNLPKVGDYQVSEETMLLLMRYVEVDVNGSPMRLTTKALVDNHVPDATVLLKLEYHMMNYNTGFFANGDRQSFLDYLISRAASSIMPMLTPFLQQLSQAITPPIQNSKRR